MKSSVSGPYQIPESQECPFVLVDGDQVPLPRIDSRLLKLQARLGADESSTSEVYSAEYREPVSDTRHVVAVKTFQRCGTDEELHAVHHEIGLLTFASNQLHHTARCIGWCENADGSLAVVMKRYQQSLFAKLQQTGKFPLDMVIDYGKKIAMAMAELHAYNIVLCDMKPENILLDEFNNIAISDFGVSVLLKNHEQNSLDDHILHGTFNYMSPEAFDPHTFGRLSTKSDCWSFACCIIEMITGKKPWHTGAKSGICYKVTHCRQHPGANFDGCEFLFDSCLQTSRRICLRTSNNCWLHASPLTARRGRPSDRSTACLLRPRGYPAKGGSNLNQEVSRRRRNCGIQIVRTC